MNKLTITTKHNCNRTLPVLDPGKILVSGTGTGSGVAGVAGAGIIAAGVFLATDLSTLAGAVGKRCN